MPIHFRFNGGPAISRKKLRVDIKWVQNMFSQRQVFLASWHTKSVSRPLDLGHRPEKSWFKQKEKRGITVLALLRIANSKKPV